ncbi:conserved hypothetical protein [Ricinus communis]|uniref:Pectinesterase catalytic domain-containing protein n=1 Tax=Ricinus communis TaxID=3988 RepID=B9RR42_RICCO|nr:conserved hypothetical protein [Ricinus communis]
MASADRILVARRPNLRPNILVASDGSGDYSLIGEARKMAPNRSRTRFVIKIKAGVYNETSNTYGEDRHQAYRRWIDQNHNHRV